MDELDEDLLLAIELSKQEEEARLAEASHASPPPVSSEVPHSKQPEQTGESPKLDFVTSSTQCSLTSVFQDIEAYLHKKTSLSGVVSRLNSLGLLCEHILKYPFSGPAEWYSTQIFLTSTISRYLLLLYSGDSTLTDKIVIQTEIKTSVTSILMYLASLHRILSADLNSSCFPSAATLLKYTWLSLSLLFTYPSAQQDLSVFDWIKPTFSIPSSSVADQPLATIIHPLLSAVTALVPPLQPSAVTDQSGRIMEHLSPKEYLTNLPSPFYAEQVHPETTPDTVSTEKNSKTQEDFKADAFMQFFLDIGSPVSEPEPSQPPAQQDSEEKKEEKVEVKAPAKEPETKQSTQPRHWLGSYLPRSVLDKICSPAVDQPAEETSTSSTTSSPLCTVLHLRQQIFDAVITTLCQPITSQTPQHQETVLTILLNTLQTVASLDTDALHTALAASTPLHYARLLSTSLAYQVARNIPMLILKGVSAALSQPDHFSFSIELRCHILFALFHVLIKSFPTFSVFISNSELSTRLGAGPALVRELHGSFCAFVLVTFAAAHQLALATPFSRANSEDLEQTALTYAAALELYTSFIEFFGCIFHTKPTPVPTKKTASSSSSSSSSEGNSQRANR